MVCLWLYLKLLACVCVCDVPVIMSQSTGGFGVPFVTLQSNDGMGYTRGYTAKYG